MKTSMIIVAPQTTSTGPKCLIGGIVTPAMRRAATVNSSRFSAR